MITRAEYEFRCRFVRLAEFFDGAQQGRRDAEKDGAA